MSRLFSSLSAVRDVRAHLVLVAARRSISFAWVPSRLAATPYKVGEVGTQGSPWVVQLQGSLAAVHADVREGSAAAGVTDAMLAAFWGEIARMTFASVLEGLARVEACTLEGRGRYARPYPCPATWHSVFGSERERSACVPNAVLTATVAAE